MVQRKLLSNTLTSADLHHVSEFGHNPLQLFDKPHDEFDPKGSDVAYDPLRPLFAVQLVR